MHDPLLAPLLAANGPLARERALGELLVSRVQPLVAGVLARYHSNAFLPQDIDDLAAAVNLHVVRRLQHLTSEDEPIQCFDNYVVSVVYRAVYAYLRRRFPERTRLKNRLRYIFAHDARFGLWEVEGAFVCGMAEWRQRPAVAARGISGDVAARVRRLAAPAEALQALFEWAGGPLRVDDVVRLAAELWHVHDVPPPEPSAAIPSEAPSQATELENRQDVRSLWDEVKQLRPTQRAALLMNLRDVKGNNAVALLLIAGVATFDEISGAMAISPERLSEIWNDLPLGDRQIAEMLQVSRQQVINLRKAARERLERRMAARNRRRP